MSTQNTIQQIYIGLLGRAADQEGLAYWTAEIDEGVLTLEQLRANIVNEQPEYEAVFGGQTRAQVVAQLYRNLFNREPDDEGLDYWVNGGGASVNVDQLVLALNDGAAAADRLVLDNRTEVANYYTAELGAEDSFDAQAAGAIIADVDGTRTSVTQAKAAVDGGSIEVPDANPGQTFTLTDAVGENVVGTAGDDTFRAVVDGAAGATGTFNTGDSINGMGGNDTLNLLVTAASTLPAGFTVESVETVNVTHEGTSGALNLSSAQFAGVKQLWQIDNTAANADFQGVTVAADTVAGFRSTGAAATAVNASLVVDAASAAQTELSVALDGILADNVDASSVTFNAAGAGSIETINVSGSVVAGTGNDNELTLTEGTADDTETLNLAISSNTEILFGTTFAGLEVLDASGSTGNLTADVTGLNALEEVTLGSGRDNFTIVSAALTADEASVDLGAGNDIITLNGGGANETALEVTLGAGRDTIVTGTLGNIIDADDVEASLITITDFALGQDTIDISAESARVLTTAQLGNAKEEDTLADALNYVAGVLNAAGDDTAVFSWGDDAYVFTDEGDGVFGDGDGLIKIVGLDAAQLSTDQDGGLVIA